jgi:hypothetical protein
MPEVTDTVSDRHARLTASGWVRWACPPRDEQAHTFPIEDSLRDRWPQVVCSHTVPLAAVGPSVGARPGCPRCVLGVTAPGTATRRHHRADRAGVRGGLIARVHDRTHAEQSPWYPVITMPFAPVAPVERDGRVSDTLGPDSAAALALIPPRPVHQRVAR